MSGRYTVGVVLLALIFLWAVIYLLAPSTSRGGQDEPQGQAADPVLPMTSIETGSAGYAVPRLGRYYLALPEGPGSHVRICYRRRCISRTSNDAGPALSEQRLGRIADIAFVDFRYLCRCRPKVVGRIRVTIERPGSGHPRVTLPPTDTAD